MAEDSAKTRILNAAGPIFAAKGFKASTVREICDSANVNVASINYYFGDKQQLYLETVIFARNSRAEKIPEPNWSSDTSPEQKLHGYIQLLLQRVGALQTAPWQVRLLVREILHPTQACRKLVSDYFRPFLDVLMSIIDELVANKLSQPRRLKLAFSIIGQCMYYRFAGELTAMIIDDEDAAEDFDLSILAQHITLFSLGAIRNLKPIEQTIETSGSTINFHLGEMSDQK